MDFDLLKGKIALVTGGSKGIGRGMSLTLSRFGCDIAVVSRNLEEAQKVADEVRGFGVNSMALTADVTQRSQVQDMVAQAVEKFGRIDVLVSNAGMNIRKPLLELEENEWDKVIDTNLKGVFLVGQAVGSVMVKQQSGKIINIASVAGIKGRPSLGAYCSSKGAVIQLTKVMALEWVDANVQVNAIAPSYIETPMTKDFISKKRDVILNRVPMRRLGTERDIDGALLLLSSHYSDFMTGQTIFVDGGSTVS